MSDTSKPTRPSDPPARPVPNPTPKQILMADAALLQRHRNLMQDAALFRTIELAQAQYVRVLADQRISEGNQAAANFFRIEGMQEFVNILKNLGESPQLPKTRNHTEIDHKV